MRRLIPLLLALPLAGCGSDPHAAAKALMASQCAVCHTIPGVPGAKGVVGPSLAGIAKRQVIAGKLANTPDNMVRWIMHPQSIVPNTAMPELGLTQQQAREIVDYLYTLDKQ
jgi:cytochrome c2